MISKRTKKTFFLIVLIGISAPASATGMISSLWDKYKKPLVALGVAATGYLGYRIYQLFAKHKTVSKNHSSARFVSMNTIKQIQKQADDLQNFINTFSIQNYVPQEHNKREDMVRSPKRGKAIVYVMQSNSKLSVALKRSLFGEFFNNNFAEKEYTTKKNNHLSAAQKAQQRGQQLTESETKAYLEQTLEAFDRLVVAREALIIKASNLLAEKQKELSHLVPA